MRHHSRQAFIYELFIRPVCNCECDRYPFFENSQNRFDGRIDEMVVKVCTLHTRNTDKQNFWRQQSQISDVNVWSNSWKIFFGGMALLFYVVGFCVIRFPFLSLFLSFFFFWLKFIAFSTNSLMDGLMAASWMLFLAMLEAIHSVYYNDPKVKGSRITCDVGYWSSKKHFPCLFQNIFTRKCDYFGFGEFYLLRSKWRWICKRFKSALSMQIQFTIKKRLVKRAITIKAI